MKQMTLDGIPWLSASAGDIRILEGHNPDFEEVGLVFDLLLDLGESYQWGIGRLYLYAEERFGEQASQIVDAKRIRPKTLQNIVYVCRRFPVSKQVKGLPFSHHAAAAALFGDIAHPEWEGAGLALLKEAVAEGLTEDDVSDRSKQIRGIASGAEQVSFEKRPIPDRIAWLVTKTENLRKDLPDEWDPERQLLQEALDKLQLCAVSVRNRDIGEPAQLELPSDQTRTDPSMAPVLTGTDDDNVDVRPDWLREQTERRSQNTP